MPSGSPAIWGAILRTAAGAGVAAVLLAPGCVDPFNPKALRAASGAHFRLPIRRCSWPEIAGHCRQLRVCLADANGEIDYRQHDWRELSWALIVSNEAHGASDEAHSLADLRLRIPLAHETESLNVAAAAAVLLFEARHLGDR